MKRASVPFDNKHFEKQKKELDDAKGEEKIAREALIASNVTLAATNKSLASVFERFNADGVTIIGKGV